MNTHESRYEEINAVVEARAGGVTETRDEAEKDRHDPVNLFQLNTNIEPTDS